MSHLFRREFYSVLCLVTVLLLVSSCQNSEPIKIGYCGGLTGRVADLGLYGRNGATLAVEEVNAQGGIHGRQVQHIVKDDRQIPEMAIKANRELVAEGVVGIIGHMTSAMSVAALPYINEQQMLLISPTTATDQLTGIDDYFLRVMLPNRMTISTLAEHVFQTRGLRRMVVVYDDNNRAFSKEWADFFAEYSHQHGGEVINVSFVSSSDLSFSALGATVLAHEPDGVLIVAAALDAAMLCQQLYKKQPDLPVFTTMWSMTEDFIQHGGDAVEDVTFINWFDPNHPAERSRTFRRKYEERFGRTPNFASHFSYEATSILLQALHSAETPTTLKETILTTSKYQGTQESIVFNKYGDVERALFLMQVKNGKFIRLQ